MASRWAVAGLAVAALWIVGLVIVPLFELFAVALGEFGARSVQVLREAWPAALNTLWTSAAVTFLALAAGTGLALITERTFLPGRRWLRFGLLLSLMVPAFVSALSWARAYGPGGLTDDLWGLDLPGLFGAAGVVAVIAVHAVPVAYVIVAAALASRAEPDLERAARMSGAGPIAAFRTVSFPLLSGALIGAGALLFVSAANSFGIPAVLGLPAGFFTVTTRIYRDMAFSADPTSFARSVLLACGLVLLVLTVIGTADARLGLARVARTGGPGGPAAPGGRRRWGLTLVVLGYLILTIVLPLIALVLTALTKAVGLDPLPVNWTLAHFREALGIRYGAALGRSTLLAVSAASITVLLGALLAVLRRLGIGRRLGTVALLTFAVPGSTLAVAVLLAYGPWLRDTLLIILVAYLAKFWALGDRTIGGSLDALSSDLARAARMSGANHLTTLRTVTVPLLRPALAAAWGLAFLFGIHELTMSSLLYGPGTSTLAVVVLNLQQLGDLNLTAALAVVLTAPVLLLALPLLILRGPASRFLGLE